MKIKTLSAVLLLSLGCSVAQAATTADISVTGIIKPTACELTLDGAIDATVNYGVIAPSILSASAITALPVKTVPLKIHCDAATRVAVNAIDNKAATNTLTGQVNVSDAAGIATHNALYLYGLGVGGSKNIGGYSIAMDYGNAKVDSNKAYMARSSDNGASWIAVTNNGYLGQGSRGTVAAWVTWTKSSSSTEPLEGTTFEANLLVKAFIDKKPNLDLSGDVALDGSATIEIRYL